MRKRLLWPLLLSLVLASLAIGRQILEGGKGIEIDSAGNLILQSNSGDPATGANGALHYDSTAHAFRGYVNGAWAGLGGGGNLTHIAQVVVAGSAASRATVSGLDLDAHEVYVAVGKLENATGSAIGIRWFVNSDDDDSGTVPNYHAQTIRAESTSVTGFRDNDNAGYAILGASGVNLSVGFFWEDANEDIRMMVLTNNDASTIGSTVRIDNKTGVHVASGINVTALSLDCNAGTNCLEVGSSWDIYALDSSP